MPSTAPSDRPRYRESAAVVLVRGARAELETYWVKRGEAVGYMPGFHAFVGGKLDAGDLALSIEGGKSLPELDRAMRVGAIREAFEETGVLVGLAAPVDVTRLAAARERLLAGETDFNQLADTHGWRFRADGLAFAGRWTTPPFASQRFDTMFFFARVSDDQHASIIPGELASGEWVRPADAIARWQRGEAVYAAPILHILRELGAGEPGMIERLTATPEASAQPIRRIELQWGVVLLPMKTSPLPPATHTNAYLVGEREIALIDPGGTEPADIAALLRMIETLGAEGRRLTMILLTHHHPDHIGALSAVRAAHRVPVAAHPETARHVPVDVVLKDGEWLPLVPGPHGQWALQAIHTPGHTRGSMSFWQPRVRALFTGDHIPGGAGTVIIDPPEGDMEAYLGSLERLLPLEGATLYPGHGSPQGGAERRIRSLIAHRLEREGRVERALAEAPATLEQLVPIAYADVKPDLWLYAQRSLLAHLIKLERAGRAAREGDRWRRP